MINFFRLKYQPKDESSWTFILGSSSVDVASLKKKVKLAQVCYYLHPWFKEYPVPLKSKRPMYIYSNKSVCDDYKRVLMVKHDKRDLTPWWITSYFINFYERRSIREIYHDPCCKISNKSPLDKPCYLTLFCMGRYSHPRRTFPNI